MNESVVCLLRYILDKERSFKQNTGVVVKHNEEFARWKSVARHSRWRE